jgi:ABC transporter with metal-binding/Fe-S-binding domain ATP-binding protein
MRLGILFSGGKDSCYACFRAMRKHVVVCLISVLSASEESYMFHTPNIGLTRMQAAAMGLPLVTQKTRGEKEKEIGDLEKAVGRARKAHGIEGIVTGAIDSVYQAERVQKVCDRLGLWCFNPLWQADQLGLLKDITRKGFRVIISGVFAYPLGKDMLGREIDPGMIGKLGAMKEKHGISPSGEGGEIETFVTDGPIFKKRIKVLRASSRYSDYSGVYRIEKACMVKK